MLIKQLETWYENNRRDLPFRKHPNPYWIWISEIMLQQTQMDTVIPYFLRFVKRFPTIQLLAKATEEEVLTHVQGLGYYRRFRLLKQAAEVVVNRHQGQFPNRYEDIIQLPGIGTYTAGAIASIAFGLPTSAVDGNVLRVISRFQGIEEDIRLSSTKKTIDALNQQWIKRANPTIYTQAMMELGALICRPKNPQCHQCPLQASCYAYQHHVVESLPKVAKKKKQIIEHFTTILFLYNNRLGLEKRTEGLLEGMYALPQWQDQSIENVLISLNMKSIHPINLGKMVHIFTHKRWEMDVYVVKVTKQPKTPLTWHPIEAISEIPIPKAHRKLIDLYQNTSNKEKT
jgi:A/G-specific adenine glycosylase